jgi:hypothetical protein
VERERRLVREDAGLLGPEPEHDEILVLAGREVNEPVHTPPYAGHSAVLLVLVEEG